MFGKKNVLKTNPPVPVSPVLSELSNNIQSVSGIENELRKDAKMAYITPDCKITGTIKFDGPMRIDGQVDGKIIADNGELIIGETCTVKATINTKSAIIEGKVDGKITVSDKIVLRKTAHFIGDLQAKKLVVEEGVAFAGRCNVKP